jgi:hypothetical protein
LVTNPSAASGKALFGPVVVFEELGRRWSSLSDRQIQQCNPTDRRRVQVDPLRR